MKCYLENEVMNIFPVRFYSWHFCDSVEPIHTDPSTNVQPVHWKALTQKIDS